ncbi:MAG: hypothetical protein JXR36_08125 [Bacteroidales bacterium]|nr:hypothetical protein [Bacteroidales bacterium]
MELREFKKLSIDEKLEKLYEISVFNPRARDYERCKLDHFKFELANIHNEHMQLTLSSDDQVDTSYEFAITTRPGMMTIDDFRKMIKTKRLALLEIDIIADTKSTLMGTILMKNQVETKHIDLSKFYSSYQYIDDRVNASFYYEDEIILDKQTSMSIAIEPQEKVMFNITYKII